MFNVILARDALKEMRTSNVQLPTSNFEAKGNSSGLHRFVAATPASPSTEGRQKRRRRRRSYRNHATMKGKPL
jgi:hypothetical protein